MAHSGTTHDRASEFFDRYARDFNAIYGNENTLFNTVVNHLFRKDMRVRYDAAIDGCRPVEGKSVLDVGSGPGHYSVALAQMGASRCFGVDFADGMIDVAKRNAELGGVGKKCEFIYGDFLTAPIEGKFNFAIITGFMDYIKEPEKVIARVCDLTTEKAFFSFPSDGGLLAWQRKLRYKSRCDLYLYNEPQIRRHFENVTKKPVSIERLERDFFVTLDMR
ncbi:MAG TPA: class I SAM-dependent methyltransferase [Polyangiaceae bacterium]|jgi:ubiquinone/menaquinone biosynthesis C-methylase UbiE|nr:class I SAM-dependent methyltransferase [Polyangiaceae bacterium]